MGRCCARFRFRSLLPPQSVCHDGTVKRAQSRTGLDRLSTVGYGGGMALPKLDRLTQTHTVPLGDDLEVVFQLQPIPGLIYQQIIDEHRGEDGKTPWEDIAVPILTAGIGTVYSSVESTPVTFTETDAQEIWNEWPEWARWDIYQAVIGYVTKGPAGNPFSKSKPNENDEQ